MTPLAFHHLLVTFAVLELVIGVALLVFTRNVAIGAANVAIGGALVAVAASTRKKQKNG